MDCLKQKTERFKEKDYHTIKNPPHPLWQMRTVEEAAEFFKGDRRQEKNEPDHKTVV